MATISEALTIAFEHHQAGRLRAAEIIYRQILQIDPHHADAWHLLGLSALQLGHHSLAVDYFNRALKANPTAPEYHCNLGLAYRGLLDLKEAEACQRRALELKPEFPEAHNNLGNVLQAQGELDQAAECYRQALKHRPGYAEAHSNLGNALQVQGRLDQAVACCQQALLHNPHYAEAHNNLGNALKCQGKLDEAISCYHRALELRPDYATSHSNLLCALQYRPSVTVRELAEAHADFQQRHASPLCPSGRPHNHDRDPNRRLRLGFVSADLGDHPVGYFLIRALEHLDQQQAEIVCYSDRLKDDQMTSRFQSVSTTWRKVVGWSDERLTEQIREDGIDILFDLAGHTSGNRLLVFARKPAPIQITWLGYVGTTGLTAIDYLIADRFEIPSAAEHDYREQVLRMPDDYVCYDPPSYAPPVSSLPALDHGFVTFGSFNNPAKLTAKVIEVWSQILLRVPRSRLVLKYWGMNDPVFSGWIADLLTSQGVDIGRVEFLGKSPHRQLLAEYARIDLALDSFPYSGGLTTCEALWMGVPVVTCPGETFASRHSLSHLSNVGLTESVARDSAEYVELAVELASDLDRLASTRGRLRAQVAASPLCDGPRFAANFLVRLREVWRRWVEAGRA